MDMDMDMDVEIDETDVDSELNKIELKQKDTVVTASPLVATEYKEDKGLNNSWDLGLSDSILENGLFAEESILCDNPRDSYSNLNSNSNSASKKRVAKELKEEEEKEVAKSQMPSQPYKKRRDSYIPLPFNRRQSIAPSESAVSILDQNKTTKPRVNRRMSVGGGVAGMLTSRSAVAIFPSSSHSITTKPSTNVKISEENKVVPEAAKRPIRRNRMSLLGNQMKENSDPQTCTQAQPTGYFFKGLKPMSPTKNNNVNQRITRRNSISTNHKIEIWKDL